MPATTITWDALLPEARTGDLVLFHSGDRLSKVIEDVTHGDYSHVAMIVRPDPKQPPQIWQESGIALTPDPDSTTAPLHTGAQLGDLQTTVTKILQYHDHPRYRRLVWDRTPAFEAAVQEVIRTCDGRPFGTILEMAAHWFEGHVLGEASSDHTMFCSQLVALTFQRAGLLGMEHPTNWYAPSSFSAGNPDLHLLQGAAFEPEVPIQT